MLSKCRFGKWPMRKPKHDWRKKKTIAQELMITILWYFQLCFLSSTWFIGPLVWVNPHLKDDQTRVLAVRLHLLLLRLGNGSSQVRTYAHKCKYFWRIVKKGDDFKMWYSIYKLEAKKNNSWNWFYNCISWISFLKYRINNH